MSVPSVVYDACILYPAPLRDLLMHLALTDLFQAKWSADIHEEWIRNVLAKRPDIERHQLERTRTLMDAHVRDSLVSGYESLIKEIELPDKQDRHVLAAAITCQAERILTFNLKDFPRSILEPLGMTAEHPDDFINDLINSAPIEVCTAMKRHRLSLKNPAKSVEAYLSTLQKQGLSKTVAKLRELKQLL